jgi:hypothetical protein
LETTTDFHFLSYCASGNIYSLYGNLENLACYSFPFNMIWMSQLFTLYNQHFKSDSFECNHVYCLVILSCPPLWRSNQYTSAKGIWGCVFWRVIISSQFYEDRHVRLLILQSLENAHSSLVFTSKLETSKCIWLFYLTKKSVGCH